MEIRKLVIATDGSGSSVAALDFGLELALDRGAEAIILYVATPHEFAQAFGADRADPPTQAELALSVAPLAVGARFATGHAIEAQLELVVADEGPAAVADAILGVAAGRDADAIVLGSRGHGRLATAMLGSVTNAVLRDATTTVLVVREPGA